MKHFDRWFWVALGMCLVGLLWGTIAVGAAVAFVGGVWMAFQVWRAYSRGRWILKAAQALGEPISEAALCKMGVKEFDALFRRLRKLIAAQAQQAEGGGS